MATCADCGLQAKGDKESGCERTLCSHCTQLSQRNSTVRITPMSEEDLELVCAWRSNPNIYRHFRQQQGPLEWDSHVEWFHSRSDDRHDFIIQYDGRRVGVVSIDASNEVGVLLGDFSARGQGVATTALNWLCGRFSERAPLRAEIQEENHASKRLFERCGFEKASQEGNWIQYVYDE